MQFTYMPLVIYLTTLDPEHSRVADTYNNMAFAFRAQDDLEEAMKYYIRALNIYESHFERECYEN
jgi:hypothetical protein